MNSQFEDYDYERAAELRRLRRQKRRRKVMMMRAVFFLVLLLIVAGGAFAVSRIVLKKGQRYIRHFPEAAKMTPFPMSQ